MGTDQATKTWQQIVRLRQSIETLRYRCHEFPGRAQTLPTIIGTHGEPAEEDFRAACSLPYLAPDYQIAKSEFWALWLCHLRFAIVTFCGAVQTIRQLLDAIPPNVLSVAGAPVVGSWKVNLRRLLMELDRWFYTVDHWGNSRHTWIITKENWTAENAEATAWRLQTFVHAISGFCRTEPLAESHRLSDAFLHVIRDLEAVGEELRPREVPELDAQPQVAAPDLQAEPVVKALDAGDGGGRECTADYPIPDDYERDKWIYEQRKTGTTNPDIIRDLESKSGWTPLYSEDSIRDAVKRYCLYHGLPVPQGRRGRPTTKTGKPRKPPSKNPH